MVKIKTWSRCPNCDKFKSEDKEFKVDDKVNFPKSSSRGRSTRLSIHTGKLLTCGDEYSSVIYRKKLHRVRTSDLSDPNGASGLSVALIGQCECK